MISEFKKHAPAILFLWLCLAIPVAIAPYDGGVFSKMGLVVGLLEAIFPTAVIVGIIYLLKKCLNSFRLTCNTLILWMLVDAIAWLALLGELFVGIGLHCRFNEAVMLLILQSDGGETCEFLQYALGLKATWMAFGISVIVLLAALAFGFLIKKINFRFIKHKRIISIAILTASAAVFAWASKPILMQNYDSLRRSFMISPIQMWVSMRPLMHNAELIDSIAKANDDTQVVRDSLISVPHIVVVIGESDNKRHSSLYGYHLPTAEALNALADSFAGGKLLVYTNAVTGDCTTNLVMKRLLSTNIPDLDWQNCPILPAVLTKGGYTVNYFDNQSTPSTCDAVDYSSVFFLNSPVIAKQAFALRNDQRFDYDRDFVDHYIPEISMADSLSVTFFHLMGQHISASARYHSANARFSIADYDSLTEFSEKERTDIMHYDNATAETYETLSRIIKAFANRDAIVIYLSDHSEEVYDYRHQYGRTQEPVTKERAQTLFEVPMYIYMSSPFVENHPLIADALSQHSDSAVFTYDLPDWVLGLAGISGNMTRPERNIASPLFKASNHRLIHNSSVDYDSIVATH